MKPRAAHAEATARMSAPVASPRSAVLTKATVRVARQLALGQGELGKVLGLSPATVSRMFKNEWAIPEGSKAWELAAMLVRVFRSLDAVVGATIATSNSGSAPRTFIWAAPRRSWFSRSKG